MILIEETVISDDIKNNQFVCDLNKCMGACCVEGDLGAPLDQVELIEIDKNLEAIKPYMSNEGLAVLEEEGAYILDEEDDYSTTTINGKECTFAIYDEKGILKCAIERAYKDGKSDFQKPISCHLYPIRITKYENYDALNYDRWGICGDACSLGEQLKVPIYKFLKEPLIRKYGEDWYEQLEEECNE